MAAPPKFRDQLEQWNRSAAPPEPPRHDEGAISGAEGILIVGIAVIAILILVVAVVRLHPTSVASTSPTPVATNVGQVASAQDTPEPTATSTAVPPTATPLPVATLAPDALVQQTMPDVALIQTKVAEGTGFLIQERVSEAVFVTNDHVVRGSSTAIVTTSDKVNHLGRVLGGNDDLDLALVVVENLSGLTPLAIGTADELKTGDSLFVMGYALGLKGDPTVTRGILSGRRSMDGISYVQTDAAINHGNSGGPVLNAYGQVVGVASYSYNGGYAQGISFAIPAEIVTDYVTHLLNPAPAASSAGQGTWTRMPVPPDQSDRTGGVEVWTGKAMVIWGGQDDTGYLQTGLAYSAPTNSWTQLPTKGAPTARYGASAIWTGKEMLVWGGRGDTDQKAVFYTDGASYNPDSGTWSPIAASPLSGRVGAEAVWTGTEMLIWGGSAVVDHKTVYYNDGARYNPATTRWTKLPVAGAPSGRTTETAIWTGQDLIIWGGTTSLDTKAQFLGDGARYNPKANTWTPLPAANAPSARSAQVAVWTGQAMIIWGGASNKTLLNSGASYNPTTNTWTPLAGAGAPSPRALPGAAWVVPPGAKSGQLVIWGGMGGDDSNPASLADGARYDPTTNTWSPLPASPIGSRMAPAMEWDGNELIVWGGIHFNRGADMGGASFTPDGARYQFP